MALPGAEHPEGNGGRVYASVHYLGKRLAALRVGRQRRNP
ncbi:MAG: DUF2080 family transposase-associated protein [Oscillospiraceae bacterium]|nr:DUF2080 family transposase-associated protein [Oscillospiraceae bacterium]